MLVVISVLSMAVGSIVAIAQTNIKRMLAYSTISHIGYTLLGVLAGTAQGYQAAMFYIIKKQPRPRRCRRLRHGSIARAPGIRNNLFDISCWFPLWGATSGRPCLTTAQPKRADASRGSAHN